MKYQLRTIVMLGLTIMAAFFCTACTDKSAETPEEDPLNYVYKATPLSLSSPDYGIPATEEITWDGEKFTVIAARMDEYGYWAEDSRLCTFTPDNPVLTEEPVRKDVETDSWTQRFSTADTETMVTKSVPLEGERFTLMLSLLDAAGQERFTVDIAEPFLFDYTRVFHGDGVFKLLEVLPTETTAGLRYLVLTTEGLCALDERGEICWLTDKEEAPTALLETEAGILYLFGGQEQQLRLVDPVDGEWGEEIPLPEVLRGGTWISGGDGTYALYVQNHLALWGVGFTLSEEGAPVCVPQKLLDWAVSELSSAELKEICIATPETIAVLRQDALGDQRNMELWLLTHVPREQVEKKETVTVAALNDVGMLARVVADFNRSSDTHRVLIKDYSHYEAEQRKTFLDADMASGKIPDMIVCSDTGANLVESYEQSGLFADLTPFLAADKTLSEDLLGYVTEPYLRRDGAQYVFPLRPFSDTRWGKASHFDGPVSVEEMLELVRDLEDPATLTGGSTMYIYWVQSLFLRFADLDAGTCSFDDPLFTEALETILPFQKLRSTSDVLLPSVYLQEGVYGWVMHGLENGGELVPVGFAVDGENLYTWNSYEFLGITEASSHKEICMELLKGYIDTQGTHTNNWLTRSQIYENLAEYEGITIYLTPDGPETIEDAWLAEPGMMAYLQESFSPILETLACESIKLTRADAEEFIAFLDDIDGVLPMNTALFDIYWEECMNPGKRTAEEIAQAIQSRAALYLAEVWG